MKKRVLIATIIMVCAGIMATICITAIRMEKKDEPIAFHAAYGLEDLSLLEAGAETEGSLCLVAPKGNTLIRYDTILGKYVIFQKAEGEKYKLPEETESWEYIEKYNVDVVELYNFHTGQVERELDFVSIAQENTPGKQFRYSDSINGKVIDGREYIGWRVYPVEDPHDYRQAEIITYNLEEEKVVDYVNVNVPPLSGYTEEEEEYFKSFF